jgi:thioredoxin 1
MILDEVLMGTDPVVLMLNHGETLAADISRALEGATKEGLKVVRVNVDQQPQYADQFEVGKHPVLVVWHCGEVVSRRSRPWASDVQEIVKAAKDLLPTTASPAAASSPPAPKDNQPDDAPITVTDSTFEALVLKSQVPVLVDFWADWCGPCKMVAPILDRLAKEFKGKVRIAKVDVDRNPMLSSQFRIQSIPSLMFVKNGKIVGLSAGAAPEPALRDAINQLLALKV